MMQNIRDGAFWVWEKMAWYKRVRDKMVWRTKRCVQNGAKNGAICSVLQFDIQFSHSVLLSHAMFFIVFSSTCRSIAWLDAGKSAFEKRILGATRENRSSSMLQDTCPCLRRRDLEGRISGGMNGGRTARLGSM